MSDIFERNQQQNFFSSDRQTVQNTAIDDNNIFRQWNDKEKERLAYKEQLRYSHGGASLSMREFDYLYDLKEKNIITDDEVYKFASSRELTEYMRGIGIECDPLMIYNNYDAVWQSIFDDREERYASAKSRWQAINDSIQIAKNMNPMGKMGIELQSLNNQLQTEKDKTQREALQKQYDDLWEKIVRLRSENEELGKRFQKDALTTILTSTIQSAPYTGKSIAGGLAGGVGGAIIGGLATGGAGAAVGFKIGYGLGSFAASSAEMAGLMYIDLIAAGVNQKNAAGLALLGGGINGLIESSLGVVAGFGGSAVKAIGGRIISQEAQKKLAEAASKNFIKQISNSLMSSTVGKSAVTKTIFDAAKNTAGEGIEEGLQFLVDHAMLALGDVMQDDPVQRNLWGSAEFQAELKQSVIGGLAGGVGFGILSLPLNITGNVRETARQTEALKNLAIAIDDKAEFKAAAGELPITKHFNDKHFDEVFDSQEGERQAIKNEEAARALELRNKRLYGAMDTSGDTFRDENKNLYMEHSRNTESNGIITGQFAAGDPNKSEKNSYAIGDYELRGDTVAITEFRIGQEYCN